MNEMGNSNTSFGRVADDGTVYVRTGDGERVVGSWQAGSAAEGLVHFARKYDDLTTEVELIAARLDSGVVDAQHSLASAQRLRAGLETAPVVGNLEALGTRLDELVLRAQEGAEKVKATRLAARQEAIAHKHMLADEAEQIAAESTQWKAAGDRLREILEEWKTIKGIDRKTDAELWKRYAAARDAFNRRRGGHFAGLDAARRTAQLRKEELVTEAEGLADSTDWAPTAQRLKQLMAEWKSLPRAPREAEDQLWKRFRASQDHFFGQRGKALAERDAGFVENQRKKEELLATAEGITVDGDIKAAQVRLREIQSRWDAIGRVPRDAVVTLDRRLRAVEEKIRVAVDAAWQRNATESNPLLTQMREQVARAEQQLEKAKASGDRRRITDAEHALATKRQFLALAERTHT